MAVRIYSLAKELKLDSKVLVDICTSAGVTGKGSALASLTDEEVDRVKAYLTGGSKAAAPVRRPTAATAIPAITPPAPVAAKAPVVAAATTTLEPPPQSHALRREDYITPGAVASEKMHVISADKSSKTKKKASGESAKPPVTRSGTGIKLAPLPTASQPTTAAPAPEPTPQKPDLKLPVDAIRAGRAGTKPLSEHLRKHEQKRKEAAGEETVAAPPQVGKAPPRDRGPARQAFAPRDAARRNRTRSLRRSRGPAPAVAVDGEPGLLGGREQRQINRKRLAVAPRRLNADEDDAPVAPSRPRRPAQRMKRTGANTAAPRKSKVTLEMPCTVRSFSETVGVPAQQVLRQLMAMGNMLNITATIEPETVEMLALELGVEVDIKQAVDFADEQLAAITDREDDPALLQPRPPVITFLGHVDHGKTSLLDRIIGIDVASRESGGITQHIRAYQIEKDGRKISFVDTPGHEAFTEMRARGANVTDIAVLVVAADDGVMPQTEEAISHARAADVPIVVALNKIDLPGVDVQRIYQQLATNNLLPTEWGGDIEVVKTSATTGVGIDDLLETLLTIAELHDYRANPDRPAYGTCLEASLHEGRGVVAKVIVQNGTLRVGDAIVCGTSFGKAKAMYDTLRSTATYPEALPSMPVNLTGLHEAPAAGERFYVMPDIPIARQIAEERASKNRRVSLGGVTSHVTLENLFDRLGQEEVQTLNMILRPTCEDRSRRSRKN